MSYIKLYLTVLIFLFNISCKSQENRLKNNYEMLNQIDFNLALNKDTSAYVDDWLQLHKSDRIFLYSNSANLFLVSGYLFCVENDTNRFENLIIEYVNMGLKLIYFEDRLEHNEIRFHKEIQSYFNSPRGILFLQKLKKLEKISKIDIDIIELFTWDQAIREYYSHWLECLQTDEIEIEKECNTMRHFDSIGFYKLVDILKDTNITLSYYDYSNRLSVNLIHLFKYKDIKSFDSKSIQEVVDSLLRLRIFQGKYSNQDYAFFIDRPFGLFNGYPQIYGTHFGGGLSSIAADLIEPENVDQRRAKIYLPPLWQDALKYDFDLPEGYPLPKEAKKYFPQKR